MRDLGPLPTILILGGTPAEGRKIAGALSEGYDCMTADSPEAAREVMGREFVQVLICAGDIEVDALEPLRDRWPETTLVVVADGAEAPLCSLAGIQQALIRPWTATALRLAVGTAARVFRLTRENERLALEKRCLGKPTWAERRQTPGALGFEGILRTPGSPMAAVVSAARQYASFDVPVLQVGEPGTGKADFARAMHDSSLRSELPFHVLDLVGMSEEAAALTLFGCRRPGNGSPPVNKPGLVRKAELGTLYLSGVDTLSRDLQLRLLRLARDGMFERDGGPEPEVSTVRLITAVTSDPQALLDEGRLDPALYYALSTAELHLPPLRARKADLPLLAQVAAEDAGRVHGKQVHGLSEAALGFLAAYGWPGNLCELNNEITRMLILAQEPLLGPEVISRKILQASPAPESDETEAEIMAHDGPLKDRIEAIEARILRETLTRRRWNKSRSAAELGLSRVGLRAKLDRYGIHQPNPEPEEA